MMKMSFAEIHKWSPHVFLIWPDLLNNEEEAVEKIEDISSVYANLFNVNDEVYIVFIVSESSVPILWEFYGVGWAKIYRQLDLENKYEIDLKDLEGKLSRRSNFHNLSIRATAWVTRTSNNNGASIAHISCHICT